MKNLEGKVAVITGSGQGIGREEALLFAREGAKVVVNDLGCTWQGESPGERVADKVVEEIKRMGGEAAPNYNDVSNFSAAKAIIDTAIEKFGRLDILVNNAGILRDKMIFNMAEQDWDAVLNVCLKGTFNTCRHATEYFRDAFKSGKIKGGRIVNTTSIVGLIGNAGQANYVAAKAGVALMSLSISKEMKKYNVTCNAVAPGARTRLTTSTFPQFGKVEEGKFDVFHPGNIAPLVAYLASDKASNITGQVFQIAGGRLEIFTGWKLAKVLKKDARWTVEEIAGQLPQALEEVRKQH